MWDDGNNNPGDGCSADCKVENGFKWTRSSPTTPDVWTDIWGDGFKIKNEWDDGNLIDGDGWSSTWHLEDGFQCLYGSPTRKDVCTEKWGDGKDYGKNECEDGNNIDGDGWNSNWEFEEWYACSGGTPFSKDTWFKYIISATIGEVSSSNTVVISFNDTIINSNLAQNDLLVSIISSYSVSYSWTASFQSSQSLLLSLQVHTVLQGGEKLTVKFINNKKFRGQYGGWVQPTSLSSTMKSTLANAAESIVYVSTFAQYSVIGGVLITLLVLLCLRISFEMIWSLVTMQKYSFFLINQFNSQNYERIYSIKTIFILFIEIIK